jgi:predicted GIY-YIG superfamily endonuclease
MAGCYVLHFDKPYWQAGTASCQHYVGRAKNIVQRMRAHRKCAGSKLVRYALRKGIDFQVVYTEIMPFAETYKHECKLKRIGAKHFCPICNPTGGNHEPR